MTMFMGIENPPGGFSMQRKKFCVRLKFSGISGLRTDLWYCFLHQCSH
jgi:hypothetical protein